MSRRVGKRGLALGEKQGIEKGREEGMQIKAAEIAKHMLFKLHLGEDIVQQATGLSREELAALQATSPA